MQYTISSSRHSERGFTLIELLIVIVIIAILAVVSTVMYNGILNRSAEASIRSTMAQSLKKMQLFYTENNRYPHSEAELTSIVQPKVGDAYATHPNTFTYCYNNVTNTAAIGAVSRSGKGFVIRSGSLYEVAGWGHGQVQNICPNNMGVEMESATIKRWAWINPNNNPPLWSF